MTAFPGSFYQFLARIHKMLGAALTVSHERKINAQTPNDASTLRKARSASLLLRQMRPSSRKRPKAGQRLSI